MLKEYCDKCKKEIDRTVTDSRQQVKISIPGRRYSYGDDYASLTLCAECFKTLGIREAVEGVGNYAYGEKKPGAAEKLTEIIRELVVECMEEI